MHGSDAPAPANPARKILRLSKVLELTGLSRTTLWRKSRNGEDDFPVAVSLGPGAMGWFEDEIHAWINSRPRVHFAPSNKTQDSMARANPSARLHQREE